MNAAQLREDGFDDNEIRSWLSGKHAELRAAGFSDAEIEARYGPTPASPPEPPPFDLEKHFRNPDQAPAEFTGRDAGDVLIGSQGGGGSQKRDDLVLSEVLYDNFVKPWLAVGYTGNAALNRGMAAFGNNLDALAEYIESKTGWERGGAFREGAKLYEQNREYWQKRADEVGVTFLQELFGEALGGAVPGISEFLLNIPYAAALGAAKESQKGGENETGAAITEAAKRGILGKVFHSIAPLKRYLQAPVMAGVFGAQAAFEGGEARDIAKGVGTGLIYSAASPGGRYGLNEVRNNAMEYLGKADRQAREMKELYNRISAVELEEHLTNRRAERETQSKKISDFFDQVGAAKTNEKMELSLGEVSERNIDVVRENAGIDLSGYERVIDNYSINHIMKEHGDPQVERKRGQIEITREDIARIPEITEAPDHVSAAGKTRVGRETILYTKKINGEIFYYEEIRTGKNNVVPATLYKKTGVTPRATPEGGDAHTSETFHPKKNLQPSGESVKGGEKAGQPATEKYLLEGGVEVERPIEMAGGEDFRRAPEPAQGAKTGEGGPSSIAMAPEKDFRRTPEGKEAPAEKPMGRSEIRQFLEEKLDIPIRTGRFTERALGIFKPESEVIRTRYANDIEVIAHEAGHALHKYLWPETMTRKGLSSEPFQAFSHELDRIATTPRKGQSGTSEGYAEFVRLYITDAAQAQRKAPDFFNFFEAQLDLKAPEVKEIFLEARAKYQKHMQQPPLQRILSQISIGKSNKVPRNFDELYTMSVDDLHPLELAVREMGQGREIPASKDPYKLARLLRGWHGKAEAFLNHQPFSFKDYQDIPGAKSLKKILEPVRDNLDEFRAYIVAKRALELADRKIETGVYRADAEAVIEKYEGQFREVHRELLDFQDLTLQYLRDAGLLTAEGYAKMKIWNRDYVPFYRVMENTKGLGSGKGLEGRNPVKKIRGSWRDIVDPLESIIKNTHLYIDLAEKNAVGRALVDLERTGEGLGKFVEKIPAPMAKTTVTPQEIARYMENLAERLGFEARDLPADAFDSLEIFRPSAFVPKDNVIQVWENGKRSLYQVDPEIGRVFKALDRENGTLLIRLLSYPASWLRAGATLTPEFIGRNPLRDQWSAFIYSKYGFVPGFDLMRGIFSMVKKDQAYWDFKKSGADHSMLVSLDRDYLQDNLGELLQKYPIRNVVKNPINGLRMLSELGEMGTRLGEFKRGLKAEARRRDLAESTGGEPTKGEMAEAAFSAREVTLDFARMGASSVAKGANGLIAFWNAQIQGTDRLARAFRDNPVGTSARVAASITLPSVLLAIANHDDPRYKEIPQWQKDLFWIVITDKTIYRIPKPFEPGMLFGSVAERVTHYILDRDPKAFDGILRSLFEGAAPGMIPTFQAPFLENWANRSFFFDRNLVPKSREDLLPEYQYGPHTTETAKLLSSIVGRFPGLDQWKGAAPAYIENLVYGWSGGLGRYALQIADAGLKASGVAEEKFEKPSKTLADIPFIKAFVVRFPSSQAESIQRFYDNFDKALAVNKTIKVLMEKEQNPEAAAKLWQSSGMADLQGVRTALSNAHNTIDLIYRNRDMTPDEKRELIDQIYMQMIAMAQNGNKLAEGFEKARQEAIEMERKRKDRIVKERTPSAVAAQPATSSPVPENRPVQF